MEVLLTTIASMFKPDERFVMHRYYSTRIAMIAGMFMIFAWFSYDLLINQTFRLDLAMIAIVMGTTKILAMLYYRLSH